MDDEIENTFFFDLQRNVIQGQPTNTWQDRVRIQSCLNRNDLKKTGFGAVREPNVTSVRIIR